MKISGITVIIDPADMIKPHEIAFAVWFHKITEGKPRNFLPTIRETFLAGWEAHNDEANKDTSMTS